MNNIAIKSILLLLLFYSSAMGQTPEPGKIRYSLGYGFGLIQSKEENLIPKVHRGVANFLDFRIEKKDDLYRLFQLQLGYGKLKTAIENEAVSFNAQLSLSYCHDFKIIENKRYGYYLGPRASFTSSLSEYENWDEAHAYWGNFLSLGSSNILFMTLDKNKFWITQLDISMVGCYTRPDKHRLYANEYWTFSNIIKIMNSHYQFGFWNHAFQLKVATEYRTPLFADHLLALSFSVYYSRLKADDGNPLKELIHRMSVGVWL
jgi:hypothetical protein